MADVVMKTSQEWHDLVCARWPHFLVMDADGWDRKNYDASWGESITEAEFWVRTGSSTCCWPVDMFPYLADPEFSILKG